MQVTVVLLIAGSGRRFGTTIPKQYIQVAGIPLLIHCLKQLEKSPFIQCVQPVIAQGDPFYHDCIAQYPTSLNLLDPVTGGKERVHSMQAGLSALSNHHTWVAIHDAARPLLPSKMLTSLFHTAQKHGAAAPALAVVDTIKKIDEHGFVLQTPVRDTLRAVQTPQVARKVWFEKALQQLNGKLDQVTDDMSLLELAGYPVYLSEGDPRCRKITHPEDFNWLTQQLNVT